MSAASDDKTSPDGSARTRVITQGPEPPVASTGSSTILPAGYRLGEFEIAGLIGEGGFGIVYLAHDHSLERRIALKEYMPTSLARRTGGLRVSAKSERFAETFAIGLRSFVNEAKLLAQFDHPALVKVYRFWESNGTAYMAMPFYEGITLRRRLGQMSAPPSAQWLKRILSPLMDALEVIHREQCYHRDIAPDNIMLLEDDRPLLLDFGAARRVIADMTQALTVILRPGYAPIEQYAEVPGLRQGAFTDVYALAAVLYYAILGETPPVSVGRMMNDTMKPISLAAAGRYDESFLWGIDQSLAVKTEDRPQSIAEMRALLGVGEAARAPMRARLGQTAPPGPSRSVGAAGAPAHRPSRSRNVPVAALAVGLAALGIAGVAWLKMSSLSGPAPPHKPAAAAAASVPADPPQRSAGIRPPFSSLSALEQIFQQRNREHSVTVALDQPQVRILRDKLTFRLRSSRPGYLYVFMVGTDRRHFYLLFPNEVDDNNRVEVGSELALPRPGWSMVASGPPGANHFVAIVAESPRDLSAAGLRKVDPFAEFPLAQAERTWQTHSGKSSPFIGTTRCPPGTPECSQSYGAAIFTIDEVN